MEELIKRINQIMRELGYLKPSQFADEAGLNRSNFSQMMHGKRVIGEGVINKICLHLNIDKNWLLTGKGSMLKDGIQSKSVNFNDIRSGEQSTLHSDTVSRQEYEALRSKYLNSLEENIRLMNEIDRLKNKEAKHGA